MLGCTFQGTLAIATEEVFCSDGAAVTTEVASTGSGLAGICSVIVEAQYEAPILGCIGLHLDGALGWLDAVAATLALTEGALVLVGLCAVRLTGVEYVDVTSQDALIDGRADSTAALMGVSILELDAADYLGTGLKDDLMYELLQGLLGLGVGGESLFQDLSLLYHGNIIDIKCEHK